MSWVRIDQLLNKRVMDATCKCHRSVSWRTTGFLLVVSIRTKSLEQIIVINKFINHLLLCKSICKIKLFCISFPKEWKSAFQGTKQSFSVIVILNYKWNCCLQSWTRDWSTGRKIRLTLIFNLINTTAFLVIKTIITSEWEIWLMIMREHVQNVITLSTIQFVQL